MCIEFHAGNLWKPKVISLKIQMNYLGSKIKELVGTKNKENSNNVWYWLCFNITAADYLRIKKEKKILNPINIKL